MSVQGDSIFAIDEENFLVRLRRDDGRRLWRLPVAEAVDQVQGITYMPGDQRIYLTMGGSILVLDAGNGTPIGRHRLDRTASTPPLAYGSHLIYGARNGQLIWYLHDIGFPWRTYQVARSIDLQPVLVGNSVVSIGSDGIVMALHAGSVAQMWSKKLLDRVVAAPAAGAGMIYIAGTDQYIYAIEVDTGRTRWSKLTTSPLTDPPTLVNDSLYQFVPGEGLMCLDALANDAPGGRVRWVSADVRGTVLTQRGRRLLVWSDRDRRMSIVEAGRGSLVEHVTLPQVTHVQATAPVDGELYAAADDGRVVRVVPRD
jgi:outer membrane protein assembly factor BamB